VADVAAEDHDGLTPVRIEINDSDQMVGVLPLGTPVVARIALR
jgi:hypothetical protein